MSKSVATVGFRGFLRGWCTASAARTAWFRLRALRAEPRIWVYPNVHASVGKGALFAGPGSLHIGRRWPGRAYLPSEFTVAENARVEVCGEFSLYTGGSVAVNRGATLLLGSGYINHRAIVECFDRISIGDHVAIAKGVTIRDSDAHSVDGRAMSAPIAIGNHVWIGVDAIVLKGVTIGDGAVVGAGAIVTHDVPPRSLVAGVPARVLKTEISWS